MRAENGTLRVNVLGSVRAWCDDTELTLGRPTQRAVLAILAMHAGRAVSRDWLIDALWGEDPPASAVNGLHVYISELRRILEPERRARSAGRFLVSADNGGYLLRVDSECVDANVFAELLRRARQERASLDLTGAIGAFDAALELWHGPAWTGIPGPFAEVERTRLNELYATGVEDRAAALLAADRPSDVVADLHGVIREYPLREGLRSLMMLALYRLGRQAEAYAVYESVRRLLADELGVEPANELQRLYTMMISADPALDVSARDPRVREPTEVADPPSAVPRQLPPPVRPFVGRQPELTRLGDLARQATGASPAVVVAVIDGTAGVGKTTLAVYFAHQVASDFPDGQLYVNLRGFGPDANPASPAQAIRTLLSALAVDPAQIPADTDAMVSLYRSVIAGRRILLVLDNARSEEQVRSLLPGSGGSVVIVTSRRRLTGLIVDGASLLALDVMPTVEARALLTHRMAGYRPTPDAESANELVRLCAGLPLALAVVAARAAGSPRRPLASVAAELRTARHRLNALDSGEPATSVRSALSWSYGSLSASAAHMFRALGVHSGPDISVPAAASLASVTSQQARAAITELEHAHLIGENTVGRYAVHDLLRAYAAERLRAQETVQARQAALTRVLDHYLHSAYAAAVALNPTRKPITLDEPRHGVQPESFAGRDEAGRWFEAEHQVLMLAAGRAARAGLDVYTWQFAWCLTEYLDRSGYWHEWAALWRAGLAAAERLGDPSVCARAGMSLARAHIRLARYEDARACLQWALDVYSTIADPIGQAHAYLNLAWLCDREDRPAEALKHVGAARDLYQTVGDQHGEADCLNAIGWYQGRLGHADLALAACQQAVTLLHDLDDRLGEAMAWDSLGYAHHRLEQHDEAVACFERAVLLRERIGDRYNLGASLVRLGDSHLAGGSRDRARDAWQQALAIFEDLRHQDRAQVRAKLANLA